jgi:hypothetical protein
MHLHNVASTGNHAPGSASGDAHVADAAHAEPTITMDHVVPTSGHAWHFWH